MRSWMIRLLTQLIPLLLAFAVLPTPCAASTSAVSRETLPALTPAQTDLPWEPMIPAEIRTGPARRNTCFTDPENAPGLRICWHGRVGTSGRAGAVVSIDLVAGQTPDEAVKAALSAVAMTSGVLPEVTGDARFARIADRAWYSTTQQSGSKSVRSIRAVYCRRNVATSIFVSCTEGLTAAQFLEVLRALSRRADAAAAGKPEPAPLIPPSEDDMVCPLPDAWEATIATKAMPGSATTIAVQVGDAPARTLPAFKAPNGEWLVPLRYLVAVAKPRTPVKIIDRTASFTLSGKRVTLDSMAGESTVNGESLKLRHGPILHDSRMMVPVTMLETLLGKTIKWTTIDGMPLAKL